MKLVRYMFNAQTNVYISNKKLEIETFKNTI